VIDRLLPVGWFLSMDSPIRLPNQKSEPEPDGMILRGEPRDIIRSHPDQSHVGLLIEIADSSYAEDRGPMARLYAAAGVPRMWILDLNRRVLIVLTDPTDDGYATIREFGEEAEVPIILDGDEVARLVVREVLP
jgi:Uma2 family endonuclease